MTIFLHEIRLVGRRKKDDALVFMSLFSIYTNGQPITELRTDGNDRRIINLGDVLNIYEKCASS
jgi:hypothetical protein